MRVWTPILLVGVAAACGDNIRGNRAPTVEAFTLTTQEDLAVTRVIAAEDFDLGNVLTAAVPIPPENGDATISGLSITYTPAPDYHGPDQFALIVSDGTDEASLTVDVTVVSVEDLPFGGEDALATNEDTPRTVPIAALLANDSDADGDALSLASVGNSINGLVSVDNGNVTFTPNTNFNGEGSFIYTVSDGKSATPALVRVLVGAANDAPDAVDDFATTLVDTPVTVTVATLLANDTDPENQILTVQGFSGAVNGTVAPDGNGDPVFTPSSGFSGDASFDYTISDGIADDTATVHITVTVPPVCGNGVIEAPEQCDDDDLDPGDGCNEDCEREDGFACTGVPSTCTPICGDGQVVGAEECDDDNADETDGCTSLCVVARTCNGTEFPGGDRFAVDITNGHCYVSFDGTANTFDTAQSECVAQGGFLVTITSPNEQTLAASVQNTAENPWIGAFDVGNDNDAIFAWVTNEPFGFENFANGQPDDDAGNGNQGECLHLENAAGEWNDTNCDITTFVRGQICEFHARTCGDGVVNDLGEECDDGNNVGGDGCSSTCLEETLFFSEYVEGSLFNKALEIRNLSTSSASLAGCVIRTDFAGGTQSVLTLPPVNTIGANDVLVICHALIDATAVTACDILSADAAMTFDGNDTVSLVCGGTVLDVIGDVGFDPGTEWGTGLRSTADNTLRRKCGVANGDVTETGDFEPALAAEWVGFASDTLGGLGDSACEP